MTSETPSPVADVPGHAWLEIVTRPTPAAFAAAFTPDVVLDASVLADPFTGPADLRRFFDATRAMYDRIAFTHETTVGPKTYLEWEGVFQDQPVAGVTILTRNAAGAIASIRLHHRPYDQVVTFAADLRRRLDGTLELDT